MEFSTNAVPCLSVKSVLNVAKKNPALVWNKLANVASVSFLVLTRDGGGYLLHCSTDRVTVDELKWSVALSGFEGCH